MDCSIRTTFYANPLIPGIDNCDSLVVFSDGVQNILPIKDKRSGSVLDFLSNYFNKFNHVIWFDDNDSSGTLKANIIPFVNLYLKPQILKDTSYYLQDHLTGAFHRDYANENYGIPDNKLFEGVIRKSDLDKIRLGWNLSLINWNYYNSRSKVMKLYNLLLLQRQNIDFVAKGLSQRSEVIDFQGRFWGNDPTIGWWRDQTMEYIRKVNTRRNIILSSLPNETMRREQYQKNLREYIVLPSPFGKGEICYRDFECFFAGCILFKPSMEHLITWPDLYSDGETYISHSWDFRNFIDKIEDILTHPIRYEEVAVEGQKRIRNALSDGYQFALFFKNALSI